MTRLVPNDFQKGFALLNAVFILVVLAFLGVTLVTLSGVQSRTPVFALHGAQAYHAARSGLEWGIAKVPACNGVADNSGFAVAVACNSIPASGVYQIVATASRGGYGSPDYVWRRVQVKVTWP